MPDPGPVTESRPGRRTVGTCPLARFGLWLVFVLAGQPGVWAATGIAISLPNAPINPSRAGQAGGTTAGIYSTQSGLRLRIDTTWAADRAYRPIRVSVHAPGPSPSDRLLTLGLFAGNSQADGRAIRVEHDFLLPQGESSVTTTLALPQLTTWSSMGWEVWVDGVKDGPLSMKHISSSSSRLNTSTLAVLLTGHPGTYGVETLLKQWTNDGANVVRLRAEEFPARWIDYSGLDVLMLTNYELLQLQKINPVAWSAILRWLRTGGNLWIHDLGDRWQKLPDVEKVLLVEGAPAASSQADPLSQGWRTVRTTQNGDGAKGTSDLPSRKEDPARQTERSLLWRPLGMGTVCVNQLPIDSSTENPLGGDNNRWFTLLQQTGWQMRHGFSPGVPNSEFNNWLIPGVGTAPVTEFQFLITCFVIAIGPLNYWLLKRHGRLPLLLVTVPLIAVSVTLLLFAYGLIADGLGVQVRARSYTWIDQHAGESVSWTRASYYAGMAPAEGMEFSRGTVIYPLTPSWERNAHLARRSAGRHRELLWGKTQHLRSGWLPSRMPSQFILVAARHTTRRLEIEPIADGWRVLNQLGTHLRTLVVVDPAGEAYWCEDLAPQEGSPLQPVKLSSATQKLRGLFSPNDLQFPPGSMDNSTSYLGPLLSSNRMEIHLQGIVTPGSVTSMTRQGLTPGTYVAITSAGPPVGLAGATEVASFHVLQGSWQP